VRLRRAFTLEIETGGAAAAAAAAGAGRRWLWKRRGRLVAPERASASPGHAHERVVDVDTHDASSAP
jgi:hypothetical protein